MKFVFNNIDNKYVKNRHEPLGDIQPKYWFLSKENTMLVKRQHSQKVTGQAAKSKMFNHFGEYFGYLLAKKSDIKACPVDLISVHDKKNKYSQTINLYTACGSIKLLKPCQDMILGELLTYSFSQQYPEKYQEIINEQNSNELDKRISIDESDNVDIILASVVAKTIKYEKQIGKRSENEIRADIKENISDMINMIVYDCMFGNNDRHSQNWACYTDKENGRMQIYPLYDNERVLGLSMPTEEMKRSVYSDNLLERTEQQNFSRMGISPIHSGVTYKQMLDYLAQKYPEYTLPVIKKITDKVSVQDIEELFVAAEGITSRSEFSNELTEADELPPEYKMYAKTLYSSRREYARELLEKYKYIKPEKENLEELVVI